MDKVACVVVGAGVVGLAVARTLALSGREVLILERETTFGTGISARNSEVIHAGLYYPRDSLKARCAVAGRKLLYAYCAERGIAHRRCGKLIVATHSGQLGQLSELAEKAAANGVDDVQYLERAALHDLEPDLQCVGALLSPSTGIVDSHALMLSLLGDAQAAGAMLAVRSPVLGAVVEAGGIRLQVGGADPMAILAEEVINCAGLGAQCLAEKIEGLPRSTVPGRYLAKGNYYALAGKAPFSHLVYPLPEAHGLGVHLTLDLAGQARFGPDVVWVEGEDYAVDPLRAHDFYAEIRRYWPALPDGALQPAYAGIRPKAHAPTEPACDFLVSGPASHGVNGLVNLYGIESPGLTAALALAEYVKNLLR